jgi:hypothetical protein
MAEETTEEDSQQVGQSGCGSISLSRCPNALRAAIRLFVFCCNCRQLYKQRYPNYPAYLMDFVSRPL